MMRLYYYAAIMRILETRQLQIFAEEKNGSTILNPVQKPYPTDMLQYNTMYSNIAIK